MSKKFGLLGFNRILGRANKAERRYWPRAYNLWQAGARAAQRKADQHYEAYQRAYRRRQEVKPGSGAERRLNRVLDKRYALWQAALDKAPEPPEVIRELP